MSFVKSAEHWPKLVDIEATYEPIVRATVVCPANIYGAMAPTNTGIVAIQSAAANQKVHPGPPYPNIACCFNPGGSWNPSLLQHPTIHVQMGRHVSLQTGSQDPIGVCFHHLAAGLCPGLW